MCDVMNQRVLHNYSSLRKNFTPINGYSLCIVWEKTKKKEKKKKEKKEKKKRRLEKYFDLVEPKKTKQKEVTKQVASLYDHQEVFVWSNCPLDLGTDFLVDNMVFCEMCSN